MFLRVGSLERSYPPSFPCEFVGWRIVSAASLQIFRPTTRITFDLQYTHSSYGMGMTILFVDHDINRYAKGPVDYAMSIGLYTHHSGAQNKRGTFILGDNSGYASQRSRRSDNTTWYRIHLVYDKASGLGDLVIVDRARQSVFHEDHGFALSPGAFNRIAFGATCRYNDGTSAEMRIDNVRVRIRH